MRSWCSAAFLHAVREDPRPSPTRELGRAGLLLDRRIAASQHSVERSGPSLRCLKCRASTSVKGSRAWLASPCATSVPTVREGVLRASGAVRMRVGHIDVHESHALYFSDHLNLHFCGVCGSVARRSLRLLSGACKGYALQSGSDALRRIERGMMPGTCPSARAFNSQLKP